MDIFLDDYGEPCDGDAFETNDSVEPAESRTAMQLHPRVTVCNANKPAHKRDIDKFTPRHRATWNG